MRWFGDKYFTIGVVNLDPTAIYGATARVTSFTTFGSGPPSSNLGRFSTTCEVAVVRDAYWDPQPTSPPAPRLEIKVSIVANFDTSYGTSISGLDITGLEITLRKMT